MVRFENAVDESGRRICPECGHPLNPGEGAYQDDDRMMLHAGCWYLRRVRAVLKTA